MSVDDSVQEEVLESLPVVHQDQQVVEVRSQLNTWMRSTLSRSSYPVIKIDLPNTSSISAILFPTVFDAKSLSIAKPNDGTSFASNLSTPIRTQILKPKKHS